MVKTKEVITEQMQKILVSLITIGIVASSTIGSARAYFTDTDQSSDNTLTTGSLSATIQADNGYTLPYQFTNLVPGDSQQINFNVQNTGSLPLYLKIKMAGTWAEESLDSNLMALSQVEHWNGTAWETMATTDGEYFYTAQVSSGNVERFRSTVTLSNTASNDYQEKVYTASIKVAAKQVVDGAEWPMY